MIVNSVTYPRLYQISVDDKGKINVYKNSNVKYCEGTVIDSDMLFGYYSYNQEKILIDEVLSGISI